MKNADCTEKRLPLIPALRAPVAAGLLTLTLGGLPPAPASAQATDTGDTTAAATTAPQDTAAQPPAPREDVEPAPEPLWLRRDGERMRQLAEAYQALAPLWLEAEGRPFLALMEEDLSGSPVGAVLLLDSASDHPPWVATREHLRDQLPRFGWHTLQIHLPEPRLPAPPGRPPEPVATPDPAIQPETSAADPDAANAPPGAAATNPLPSAPPTAASADDPQKVDALAPETLALARLRAAIDHLQGLGVFNIVLLGQGPGAARATCALPQLPGASEASGSRLIRALVLIDAHNRVPGADASLPDCLRQADMPVLDVYTGRDIRARQDARARQRSSSRQGYQIYEQIRLTALAHDPHPRDNHVARRVRGFIEKHARGVKLDSARLGKTATP